MACVNDGSRSLIESIMLPEVILALKAWMDGSLANGILIGTCALSYHSRPRMTDNIDFIFVDEADIPRSVKGFTRADAVTFFHDETNIQVLLLTPKAIGASSGLIDRVTETATLSNGIRIASASALVALKLFQRSAQAQADVVALIKTGMVDLTGFAPDEEKRSCFDYLVSEAQREQEMERARVLRSGDFP